MTSPPPTENPPVLLFATLLESLPPGTIREIKDLFVRRYNARGQSFWTLNTPDIQLHCSSELCGGLRIFKASESYGEIQKGEHDRFAQYICRNCEKKRKTFAVRVHRLDDSSVSGSALKFGEWPIFGPPIPSRLLSMVGSDRDALLKGRRSESQSLGIGAFSYYRRVVESQKDHVLGEIHKAATRLGTKQDVLDSLQTAKAENQFSRAINIVKDGIPDGLKIKGHNPLKLLHQALSEGIHELSDEECLERAQAIRTVLTELVANIARVMKDEKEVDAALNKLLSIRKES